MDAFRWLEILKIRDFQPPPTAIIIISINIIIIIITIIIITIIIIIIIIIIITITITKMFPKSFQPPEGVHFFGLAYLKNQKINHPRGYITKDTCTGY